MPRKRSNKQPRLQKVIRVGTRKPGKNMVREKLKRLADSLRHVPPLRSAHVANREQTSARVAQAAGRLLQPSRGRKHALGWLKDLAEDEPNLTVTQPMQARVILAMLRDGVTVAGSALTQRPNKAKR